MCLLVTVLCLLSIDKSKKYNIPLELVSKKNPLGLFHCPCNVNSNMKKMQLYVKAARCLYRHAAVLELIRKKPWQTVNVIVRENGRGEEDSHANPK